MKGYKKSQGESKQKWEHILLQELILISEKKRELLAQKSDLRKRQEALKQSKDRLMQKSGKTSNISNKNLYQVIIFEQTIII